MGAQQILLNPTLIAGASAWDSIPAATAYPAGTQWRVTDIGSAGSIWVSDGTTRWYPINGSVTLLSTALPMILPSSGSIGNNGALSGLTALNSTYPNAYLYFPANAIVAGSAAGLYYCVMSSTTAGTIYNNTYTGGIPTVPASPTAFSTTGPGAYTQTTASNITVLSVTVPANSMGVNGRLESIQSSQYNNTAGVKTISQSFGGGVYWTAGPSTSATNQTFLAITNAGVANRSVSSQSAQPGFYNSGGGGSVIIATDTTSNQTFAHLAQLATATDWLALMSTSLKLITP